MKTLADEVNKSAGLGNMCQGEVMMSGTGRTTPMTTDEH